MSTADDSGRDRPRTDRPRTDGPRTHRPRTDRSDGGRRGAARTLAPHVDPAWAEAAILELRMLDVPGDRIGAVLAEVDAHCVDSGEPAADAFGDPVAYARSLALPAEGPGSPGDAVRAALPPLLQVLGMLAVLAGVPALRRGELVEMTTGHLGMLAVLLAVVMAFGVRRDGLLRALLARPVVATVAASGVVVLATAVLLLGTQALARVPAGAAVAGGAAALAAGVVWGLARWPEASPLVAPGGAAVAVRGGRLMRHVVAWQVPAATAVLAAVVWWLTP